jgi:hypothetical protein
VRGLTDYNHLRWWSMLLLAFPFDYFLDYSLVVKQWFGVANSLLGG